MGGMFVDTLAVYCYKSVIRLFRFIESIRWARAAGSVLECSLEDSPVGCSVLTIRYQVCTQGESRQGAEEIPFISAWFAKMCARKYLSGRNLKIRVHPTYSTETRLFEFDQE